MIRLAESSKNNQITPYAVAVITPVLALIIAILFTPIVKTTLLFFIIAVLFSAWFGGLRPGLLCALLSELLLNFFLFHPTFTLVPQPSDIPLIILFAFVGILISVIEESRLQIERDLRQSRDQLQIVLSGINNGVTAQKEDGTVIFANDTAARMAGFSTPAEMISTPIGSIRRNYEIFDEEGEPLPFEKLPSKRVFSEKTSSQIDYQWHYSNDDETRWMNYKSSPVFDQNGQVQMAINIITNITADKMVEVELKNAHQRLQTMLASINNGVVATDTEGRIELMNPMAETITGWNLDQATGKPFEDIVTLRNDAPGKSNESPAKVVLRDKAPISVSSPTTLISKDGFEIPVGYNAAPIRDQYGSIVGAVMVFRDITDRQKSERELTQLTLLLAAQQRRLENLLANIPGVVWESVSVPQSQEQRIDFVNSYAERVLGYSREEWTTTPNFSQKIVHPEDVEASQRAAAEMYNAGKMSAVSQFRCIAKDGHVVPIEAHYTILTDETGKVTGTAGLMMDISQRQADENALKQSALDLKRSNEQLEQFAYVASHDLQEPLRMVTSYLQLLERRYKDHLDQDAHEFIGYAVDGATRMKALINDLLAYSRVKTGEKDFTRFDSKAPLEQAMTNLQVSIAEAKADIIFDKLPVVLGDSAQFVQLFQNLISNAIKFHGDQPPHIEIKAERAGSVWKFSVKDNGIGIEPQYVERIFVIFQRLHTKDRYPGTGIGLAICKKVVEHHGGRIWAESTPGAGTTFWFTIPSANWSK